MGPEFLGKRREEECLVTKGNRAPNIVLIMADQLAPQFTGAYGHPVVKTPHIDALAYKTEFGTKEVVSNYLRSLNARKKTHSLMGRNCWDIFLKTRRTSLER